MDTKKLERIVIIILALLNVFLLILVLGDAAETRKSRRETAARLAALLEGDGIEVASGASLLQDCPPVCTVVRDLDAEEQRIRAMLGRHSSEDMGGSIWFYNADSGQAMMRGTGEFDMLLTGDGMVQGNDPVKTAAAFLSGAGVELHAAGAAAESGPLEMLCGWDGYPIYNAALEFDFSGDRLYMVSGTMVFNRETAAADEGMDSVSALMRFLALAKREGFICSRLESLEPGYYMNVTMSGESTLTPVWRITADTGDFYINAVTGRAVNP